MIRQNTPTGGNRHSLLVNNNFTNIRRITPACVLDKTGGEWYNIICYPRLYIEVQA